MGKVGKICRVDKVDTARKSLSRMSFGMLSGFRFWFSFWFSFWFRFRFSKVDLYAAADRRDRPSGDFRVCDPLGSGLVLRLGALARLATHFLCKIFKFF